jgi:hypothetical protein
MRTQSTYMVHSQPMIEPTYLSLVKERWHCGSTTRAGVYRGVQRITFRCVTPSSEAVSWHEAQTQVIGCNKVR